MRAIFLGTCLLMSQLFSACAEKRGPLITQERSAEELPTPTPEIRRIPPPVTAPRAPDQWKNLIVGFNFLFLGEDENAFTYFASRPSIDGREQCLPLAAQLFSTISAENIDVKMVQVIAQDLQQKMATLCPLEKKSIPHQGALEQSWNQLILNTALNFTKKDPASWAQERALLAKKINELAQEFADPTLAKIYVEMVLRFSLWSKLAETPEHLELFLGKKDLDHYFRLRLWAPRNPDHLSPSLDICQGLQAAPLKLLASCALATLAAGQDLDPYVQATHALEIEKKYYQEAFRISLQQKRPLNTLPHFSEITQSLLQHLRVVEDFNQAQEIVNVIFPLPGEQKMAILEQLSILADRRDLDSLEHYITRSLHQHGESLKNEIEFDVLHFRALIALKRKDGLVLNILSERAIRLGESAKRDSRNLSTFIENLKRGLAIVGLKGQSAAINTLLETIINSGDRETFFQVANFLARQGMIPEALILLQKYAQKNAQEGRTAVYLSDLLVHKAIRRWIQAPNARQQVTSPIILNGHGRPSAWANYIEANKLGKTFNLIVIGNGKVTFFNEGVGSFSSYPQLEDYLAKIR